MSKIAAPYLKEYLSYKTEHLHNDFCLNIGAYRYYALNDLQRIDSLLWMNFGAYIDSMLWMNFGA